MRGIKFNGGLTSKVGEGTIASIVLPACSSPLLAASGETNMPEAPLSNAYRVLLVHDDALVSMGTAAMLEDMGHTVVECNSAACALDFLNKGLTVDILITDQSMPRMTGLELIRCVHRQWPSLPALIASGHAELPYGDSVGLVLLNKPFSQQQISLAIEKAMGRARGDHVRIGECVERSGPEKTAL